MDAEAHRRLAFIKQRDRGGNMQGIPGFDLVYDNNPEPEPEIQKGFPTPKRPPSAPPPFGQHVAARHSAFASGTRRNDAVRQLSARDGQARRAKDGKVLKMPLRVVLKSAA